MKFIDEVQIKVSSGHGGPGAVSFRRESFAPRGGPDGGDGGKGGDVIVRATKHLNSLMDFKPFKHYSAENGHPGASANCSGPAGQDLILMVPDGTVVRGVDGDVIVDMTDISEHVLLQGGRGGKGNTFFKTSVNQAPEHAQPGEDSEELEIKLELKLIADVGIIGFPNAGKSTLISRISAAKPKIADYPFTTLTPNLGVVKAGEFRSFVVADIPGLVKGAHQGVGLGIQFLRHIERTRLFIHLIDVSGMSGREALRDYEDINYEIKMYDEANVGKDGFFPLSARPQFVVFNKIDTLSSDELRRQIAEFKKATGLTPVAISAVTGKGVKELIQEVAHRVFEDRKEEL
ncbi:MAG: GTPase ObgE [Bdellovibrionaceae bacterium]|nr:GTPase ObgE [Pseudobdellovibrionaceae bacterium]